MSQLRLFHTFKYTLDGREVEADECGIRVQQDDHGHRRWQCVRCGRGGMWLSGPWWPDERALLYARTKHRCRPVEADRLVDCAA